MADPARELSPLTPPVDNKLEVIKVMTWREFKNQVVTLPDGGVYRGQSNPEWPLSSHLERMYRAFSGMGELGRVVWEAEFLNRFQIEAETVEGSGIVEDSPGERVWAIGRHHGLRTPYLDWSESPYVAAFFAYADFISGALLGTKQLLDVQQQSLAVWRLAPGFQLATDSLEKVIPTGRDHHRSVLNGARSRI